MTLVVVALLLLAGAVAPSPARAAFGLEVGQEVRNAIDVRALRKIPLPPGRWKVDASFEEKQGLNQVGRLEMPIHNLVLSNGDRQADIPVLVLRFTDLARASWTGQPCDTPHASPALSSNTFGSTASSLNIRCNRVFAFDHFRRSVGQGNMSPNAWLSKRFATLSSRSAELPVHTLVGHAYMSAHRGDWLEAWAYANPAPHGLEAAPDGGPFFRSPDRLGDRAEVARRYTRTFAEWFDGYTTAVYQQYLEGNAAEVPKFVFGNARPSTVAAAAPGNAAPPTAAPRPPPAAPQAASQAPAAAPPVARPAATAPASVHALVIGNAAYKGAPLLNSGNDARAMAQRLRTYGFEVTLLLDATQADGRRLVALRREGQPLRPDHRLLRRARAAIAWRELPDPGRPGPRQYQGAWAHLRGGIAERIARGHLPGRARLVFLDACRDNPLARMASSHTRGSGGGLAPMNAAAGTLISYATRDGSTASDGSGPNSPYTTALLAHLDEAEDISIVLRRVRQQVMDSTRGAQQPWEYGSPTGDKLVLSQVAQRR
ncbi:MAG: caspase family protein [Rubrivivax sp.]